MKYHTTLSTIVITLLILAVFISVSLFVVLELNISSPSLILLAKLDEKIKIDESIKISYSHLERDLLNEFIIYDLKLKYNDEYEVNIERVKVYSSIFSIIKQYIFKSGSLDIDLDNIDLKVSTKSSEKLDINKSLDLIKSYDSILNNDNPLGYFSYSVNINNLNINYNNIILSNIKSYIRIDRELKIKNIEVDLPKYNDDNLDIINTKLKLERDDMLHLKLSLDSFNYDNLNTSLFILDPRINLDIDSIKSLDINYLPISLSCEKVSFKSDDISFNTSKIRFNTDSKKGYYIVDKLSFEYLDYKLNSTELFGRVEKSQENEFIFDLNIQDHIKIYYDDLLSAQLNNSNIHISYYDAISLSLSFSSLDIDNIDSYTSFISSTLLTNGDISLQYFDDELYLDSVFKINVSSDNRFINSTKCDISLSTYIKDSEINDLNIKAKSITNPILKESSIFSLSYKEEKLLVSYNYLDEIDLRVSYQDKLDLSLNLSNLKLSRFNLLINEYAPQFNNYINEKTSLGGNITYNQSNVNSNIYSSLAFDNLQFNDNTFGFATRLDANLKDNSIEDIVLTLTTDIVRLEYKGELSLETLLPQGLLSFSRTSDGLNILSLDILSKKDKEYEFNAKLFDSTSSYLKGSVNWAREGIINANGELKSYESIYPIDFTLNLDNKDINFISDNLLLHFDYKDVLKANLSLDNFSLPVKDINNRPISITLDLNYMFDFANQKSNLLINRAIFTELPFFRDESILSFNGSFNDSKLLFENVRLIDDVASLNGSLIYSYFDNSLAFRIANEDEEVNISFKKLDNIYSGIILVDRFKANHIGLDDALIDIRLIGRGDSLDSFIFSGFITGYQAEGNDPFTYTSNLILENGSISFDDIVFSKNNINIKSDSISYSCDNDNLIGLVDVSYVVKNKDRDYPISTSLDLSIPIGRFDNILDAAITTFERSKSELKCDLKLGKINIDDDYIIHDKELSILYTANKASFSGNLLNGEVDLNRGECDISLDISPIISFNANGSFTKDELDIDINEFKFDVHLANKFIYFPIIDFKKGSIVEGSLKAFGKFNDIHLYGDLYTKDFKLEVWWLQKDIITFSDLHINIANNHVKSSLTQSLIIDKKTRKVKSVDAYIEANLSSTNIVDYFQLDVNIDKGNEVFVRVPLSKQNMQIDAYVNGHFRYYTDLFKNYISGDIYAPEGNFSYGMDPLPSWWESKLLVNNNFNITLGDRFEFLFPLSDDPILKAYIKDGSAFDFKYDNQLNEISFIGELDFRSGEIFYFEKNFYITEGCLKFTQNNPRSITPVIDLRARLRDFDQNGDKVDIYLVLKNSTLSDIKPTLESSPHKDINEIMAILSDAILPANSYGELNLNSVASLVTSSVDFISRFGIINKLNESNDIIKVIRNSLGLDMFSLRTNLVENLVLDTIFSPAYNNNSPISRYLNNTSIYIGKYLNEIFFLQGMIHLSAFDKNQTYNNNFTTVLADDLRLDIEVSLEWQNPLGTITFFTMPRNLSLYNLFDNFGLRYSNRVQF